MRVRTILFVGKPGSGKETQAELLATKIGFEVFSTGREFRKLKDQGTPLGTHVRETYEKGLLLPAWLASYLFESVILHKRDNEGVIFEGTGRRLPEAELFHEIATWLGRPYTVVNLDISDDEAVKRQVGRGRADSDTEEKVRVRLKEYDDHTAPVIEFFKRQNVLLNIPGERTIEEMHADIVSKFGAEA
ncbi:MAG: nucleoside monophosphate kinase [Patescibacteria group bacterium]